MIPEGTEVPAEKITFIGNAAMAGAVIGLVNGEMREEAELIAKTSTYVELSDRKDFQEEFTKSLSFQGDICPLFYTIRQAAPMKPALPPSFAFTTFNLLRGMGHM